MRTVEPPVGAGVGAGAEAVGADTDGACTEGVAAEGVDSDGAVTGPAVTVGVDTDGTLTDGTVTAGVDTVGGCGNCAQAIDVTPPSPTAAMTTAPCHVHRCCILPSRTEPPCRVGAPNGTNANAPGCSAT